MKPSLGGLFVPQRESQQSAAATGWPSTKRFDQRLLLDRLRMTPGGFATVARALTLWATSREIVRRPVNETPAFGWIAQEGWRGKCFPGRPVKARSTGQPDWPPQIHQRTRRACISAAWLEPQRPVPCSVGSVPLGSRIRLATVKRNENKLRGRRVAARGGLASPGGESTGWNGSAGEFVHSSS